MTGLILAALLVFTPPQDNLSGSRNAQTEADFRCLAAAFLMGAMAEEDDLEAQNAATLVSLYYLGRLEGREPSVDWISRTLKLEVGPAVLLPELQRCGGEVAAKGEEMVKKGEAAS